MANGIKAVGIALPPKSTPVNTTGPSVALGAKADVKGTIMGSRNIGKGTLGLITDADIARNKRRRESLTTAELMSNKKWVDPLVVSSNTNSAILKGLGLDLDTVLTPKGRRKKSAGLVGQDPAELASMLGE